MLWTLVEKMNRVSMPTLDRTILGRLFWNQPGHFLDKGLPFLVEHGYYWQRIKFPLWTERDKFATLSCTYEPIAHRLVESSDRLRQFYRIETEIIVCSRWRERVVLQTNALQTTPHVTTRYHQAKQDEWHSIVRADIPRLVWHRADQSSDHDLVSSACHPKFRQ